MSGTDNPFEIAVAAPSDAMLCDAVLQASYETLMAGAYDDDVLDAALPLMTRSNPRLLASSTYYLAKVPTGGVAGCGGWTLERPGDGVIEPGLAHIRHFAVHPEWTRMGAGRALYEACAEAAREKDVRRFECYASLNAVRFYGALGFKPVREIAIPMSEDVVFPALVMEARIWQLEA